MNPTAILHHAGQSLWLDNITRDLLTSGTLERYIAELSVTGLTSNPTIFEKAIEGTDAYDDAIAGRRRRARTPRACSSTSRSTISAQPPTPSGRSSLVPAAWTAGSRSRSRHCSRTTRRRPSREAIRLHAEADRPNLFIKIPGTPAGLRARSRRRSSPASR